MQLDHTTIQLQRLHKKLHCWKYLYQFNDWIRRIHAHIVAWRELVIVQRVPQSHVGVNEEMMNIHETVAYALPNDLHGFIGKVSEDNTIVRGCMRRMRHSMKVSAAVPCCLHWADHGFRWIRAFGVEKADSWKTCMKGARSSGTGGLPRGKWRSALCFIAMTTYKTASMVTSTLQHRRDSSQRKVNTGGMGAEP